MPRTNGCHNRAMAPPPMVAQDGWDTRLAEDPADPPIRVARWRVITEVWQSPGCQYTKNYDDPGCAGCGWRDAQWTEGATT